jgi:hypothetical protein
MKVWPIDGDWYQFTCGTNDQLVLGTIHRGSWLAANTEGTLN